jgi:hypothetical protein
VLSAVHLTRTNKEYDNERFVDCLAVV